LSTGCGLTSAFGASSFFTTTGEPLRSLKAPAAHDRLSRRQAAYHRDQVSAALAQADELLVPIRRIAGRVRFSSSEDRVAYGA